MGGGIRLVKCSNIPVVVFGPWGPSVGANYRPWLLGLCAHSLGDWRLRWPTVSGRVPGRSMCVFFVRGVLLGSVLENGARPSLRHIAAPKNALRWSSVSSNTARRNETERSGRPQWPPSVARSCCRLPRRRSSAGRCGGLRASPRRSPELSATAVGYSLGLSLHAPWSLD